jgi:hypothetical protein
MVGENLRVAQSR